jgi:hypothetical protein
MADTVLFIVITKRCKSVFTTFVIAKDANGIFELFFNMNLENLKHAKNITFILQKINTPITSRVISKCQDLPCSNERWLRQRTTNIIMDYFPWSFGIMMKALVWGSFSSLFSKYACFVNSSSWFNIW